MQPLSKSPIGPRKSNRRVTLKDIAEATGVSINTVSAVLNDRTTQVRVSESTRLRIVQTAAAMGYRRNLAASMLAGGRTRTLGILLDNLANLFAAPMAQAFEEEASLRGYQCFLGCTQYDGLRKVEYINRFLEHHVEGLLVIGVWLDPDVELALQMALSTETRVVAVDVPWKGQNVPAICGNHHHGGYLLGRHLAEQGHTCVRYVALPEVLDIESIKERVAGFARGIEEAGQGRCRFEIADTQGETEQTLGEFAYRAMTSPTRATALAISHDTHAFLAINHLLSKGVRIPEDVAITGYDDIQYEIFRPFGNYGLQSVLYPITTVRQPMREIGLEAARRLIDAIESEGPIDTGITYLDVELVVRESCRYCGQDLKD